MPMLKPKLMPTTDTAMDTDMVDMDMAVDTTVASDLPLPKLMLTVIMAVDTDMEVMAVDTDMAVDTTVARGQLMPMPMLRLTMVDTMVDTDTVDTDTAVDTFMWLWSLLRINLIKICFLVKTFLLRFYFFVKFVHLSKSSKRIKSLDAHQSQINFMMFKKLK